ncbi:MAG TPA: head GIN domain-containing protein [Allosphingosinicella sp.]|nr:head GIN domain-containing protein [Allosphingosinicella sp.]
MIRTLPLALLALSAAVPAAAAAAERTYSITDFDKVQVDGPYRVTLTTGRSSSARAEGSREALDHVSIDVQGGTLRVRRNRSAWGSPPGGGSGGGGGGGGAGPVAVTLTTRDLRNASVVGSGSLDIDGAKGLRVDLSVSGSGRLNVGSVDSDNLIVGLLGGGRITLAGRTKQLKATVQGSGDLAASGLSADDAQIASDTAGNVAVAVMRTAKVTATGAGDVEIIGSPTCTVQAKGSGQVSCGAPR